MRYIWVLFSISIFTSPCVGQEKNLISNHSFEEYSGSPVGWFYNGSQFTRLIKYWYSPTKASPDAFGPDIIVPSHWRKKGFGKIKAFHGSTMIGLTTYGCEEGKPHCREYVQIQLNESLVKGQKYIFHYWVAHLDSSLYIDKIGTLFTVEPVRIDDDRVLNYPAQLISNYIIKPARSQWHKIEYEFVADSSYNYLTLGNFFPDYKNKIDRSQAKYEYAYYYFDALELKKVPPIIPIEIPDDDLSKQKFKVGKKIVLKHIYFDLDKSELLPRSFIELDKLIKILVDHPGMFIEVHGHTDIQGEYDYNIELSHDRAHSVRKYLLENGISENRILSKGFGYKKPVADNRLKKGRQLNRRVEILITKM